RAVADVVPYDHQGVGRTLGRLRLEERPPVGLRVADVQADLALELPGHGFLPCSVSRPAARTPGDRRRPRPWHGRGRRSILAYRRLLTRGPGTMHRPCHPRALDWPSAPSGAGHPFAPAVAGRVGACGC